MTDSKVSAKSTPTSGKVISPVDLLSGVRQLMVERKLDAYYIPTADAHQSEYVADCDKRRAAITGFTGSAGSALVTLKHGALLWTDGRYFLQAENQLKDSEWKLMKSGEPQVPTLEAWCAQTLGAGARIGYDATTLSLHTARKLEQTINPNGSAAGSSSGGGSTLVPLSDQNLVDRVWGTARPPVPTDPVSVHSVQYAGASTAQKLEQIRKHFTHDSRNITALVVADLMETAWLTNTRGSDIRYNPVYFSYAIITHKECVLYVDPTKLSTAVKTHLETSGVTLKPYTSFLTDLMAGKTNYISSSGSGAGGKVWVDPIRVSQAAYDAVRISGLGVYEKQSPIQLLKATKNEAELAGMRTAHVRDAAAVCNFLSWLEDTLKSSADAKLTECSVADKLEYFRASGAPDDFVGLSFETIAGAGPNGAIIHYKPEPTSCRIVTANEMFLVDSGAQYRNGGTTDITRTVHFGTPTQYERRCFTRVLQGHIALARAVFPSNTTTGHALDALARVPLWSDGLNYGHGTGHGVGSFLSVHEGPQGIASVIREGSAAATTGLVNGMVVSNEPGYYHEPTTPVVSAAADQKAVHPGFGIRIENLIVVVPAPQQSQQKAYSKFETITLVPIQTSLIDHSLLSTQEIEWLNEYHATCRAKVASLLKGAALEWLNRNTEKISPPK